MQIANETAEKIIVKSEIGEAVTKKALVSRNYSDYIILLFAENFKGFR
jgi:hypothetical protein